jgi:RNA polymerase sigma-70 factor (ECF subfamily)
MNRISFLNDILPLKDKLFRLALRITLNKAEAEDVVQDTLMKMWNKRDEWDNIQSVEALCFTICRNLSLDRSQKAGTRNVPLDEELHGAEDTEADPHKALAMKERVKLVEKLFNELNEPGRSIMQLREIEGKNYKEIAEILNISEDQVKINLFRCRQRIRQKYSEIENYGL